MISTTTQILLVQEKLSLLESYVGWTIGGVTLTLTVLIALFLGLSFVYQRKFQKEELKNLEDELTKKIFENLEKKKNELHADLEKKINELESNLDQKMCHQRADLDRNWALRCVDLNLHGIAFKWWVSAARGYSKLPNKERLFNISVTGAKEALEKELHKNQIDDLIESGDDILKDIEIIRLKSRVQADTLEGLFKEKIKIVPATQN